MEIIDINEEETLGPSPSGRWGHGAVDIVRGLGILSFSPDEIFSRVFEQYNKGSQVEPNNI